MQQGGIDLAFDQIVLCTAANRTGRGALLVAIGEDDYRNTGRGTGDMLEAVQTLGVGQMQVEQYDVGMRARMIARRVRR